MEHDPKRLVESGYDRVAQRYLEFAQHNLQLDKSSAPNVVDFAMSVQHWGIWGKVNAIPG